MHVQRVESDNCLADVGNILEHLIFQVLQTFTFSNSMIDYDLYFSHHKRRVFLVFNLQPLNSSDLQIYRLCPTFNRDILVNIVLA